jgi:electron transfer flavoprotein alpha subunit
MIDKEKYKGTFVLIEHHNGEVKEVSFELIRAGIRIASQRHMSVTAVILGENVRPLANVAASYGADRAVIVEDSHLADYTVEYYTHAVCELIRQYEPDTFLFGATPMGRELASRVSARVGTGLVTEAIAFEDDEEQNDLLMINTAAGADSVCKIRCTNTRPQIATVACGAFEKNCQTLSARAIVDTVPVDFSGVEAPFMPGWIEKTEHREELLTKADTVICAGRGISSKEDLEKLREYAKEHHAAFAVTRPLVECGLASKEEMLGISGHNIAPERFLAFGVSGSIQLMSAVHAHYIVAVNTDTDAPLMKMADCAIACDYREILFRQDRFLL